AEVTPKVKLAAGGPNGRVSVLVSSGEAEIGLQQVSELMSNPQVEVIGMLPAELQLTTIYSAGVTTSAREAEAARALIKALTAARGAAIKRERGLVPGGGEEVQGAPAGWGPGPGCWCPGGRPGPRRPTPGPPPP